MTRPEWYESPAIADELADIIRADLAVPLGGACARPSALIPRAGRVRCGMRSSLLLLSPCGLAADLVKQGECHFCPKQLRAAWKAQVLPRAVENVRLQGDLARDARRVVVVPCQLSSNESDSSGNRLVRPGVGLFVERGFQFVCESEYFGGGCHAGSLPS